MLMEVDKRKRVLKGFGVFLGGMLVLTLVSRGIYAEGFARVSVEVPGNFWKKRRYAIR